MLWVRILTAFTLLGAPFAACSPVPPSEASIFISNITSNGNHSDEITTTGSRFEIGRYGCRHQYLILYERWVVQVPGSWWKTRYRGDFVDACNAWDNALLAQRVCGLHMTECWEMDKQYPSGAPGWLHARFDTCIGPNAQPFEHAFQVFDIGAEYHMTKCYYGM